MGDVVASLIGVPMDAMVVVGARVRCVGDAAHNGPGALCAGTVRRTTACYAFVDFGGPRLQKKMKLSLVRVDSDERGAIAAPPSAPAHYFVGWALEDGGLPPDVEDKIMALLHSDHAARVFPAAHSCRRWRDAVTRTAWVRLDLTANGPTLSHWHTAQSRRRGEVQDHRGTIDLSGPEPIYPVQALTPMICEADKHYCEWMLRAARRDPNLPTKLVSVRAASLPNLVGEIVAGAVNLQEFAGSCSLDHVRGKPIHTCRGISDPATLKSFACSLHDVEFTFGQELSGRELCATLNQLPQLRRVCVKLKVGDTGDRTGMKLRLQHLESIHIHGKYGPSIDFGSDLPSLTEYRETGLFAESSASDMYLGEVLVACCPKIDIAQYLYDHGTRHYLRGLCGLRGGRGVWGGPDALDIAVAKAQAEWDHGTTTHRYGRRPEDHIPFVSDASRSAAMRLWESRDRSRESERRPCGARLMRWEVRDAEGEVQEDRVPWLHG